LKYIETKYFSTKLFILLWKKAYIIIIIYCIYIYNLKDKILKLIIRKEKKVVNW